MAEWQIVLFCMDVPMLLWLYRTGYDQKVMDKGGWWFALYACVMLAGAGYFVWFLSQWCGGGC